MELIRRRIRVYGVVQGVGFRPTADRYAHAAGITGTVANCGPYVEINAEGTAAQIDRFLELLRTKPPKRAAILNIDVKETEADVPVEQDQEGHAGHTVGGDAPQVMVSGKLTAGGQQRRYDDFRIIESEKTSGEIFISPDIAICDDCKRELFNPNNRRYLHPFINCTCCGPRLTILESLPYDRERTSMKDFAMCDKCAAEYHDPASRRYDAQPVCCNDCGPQVYLILPDTVKQSQNAGNHNRCDGADTGSVKEALTHDDADTGSAGKPPSHIERDNRELKGPAAITHARKILAGGGIVAVKGIGGFHLACDATSDEAVARLRELKRRPAKPFAVMLRDEAAADRECVISDAQRAILTGHQKPILLLPKKDGGIVSPLAAPDVPLLGVMLPYAPIQLLLFDYDDGIVMPDALIMTSGNASGAPIARDDMEAIRQLGTMCDAILSNNRPIRTRADDSVMDFYRGKPYMIRRSRGYAPLPYMLTEPAVNHTVYSKKQDHANVIQGLPAVNDTVANAVSAAGEATSDNHEMSGSTGDSKDCLHANERTVNVLAVGGELKNTFCLGINNIFYPSSYIGDLADIRTVDALKETIGRMETLLEMKPEAIACDLHPGYNSTAVAEEIARKEHLPLIHVQHHWAHVLSCMAENDVSDQVIGVSMDGTGYGTDGTIWGGEIMTADYTGFTRIASIAPFLQMGGDAAAREGWRIAVSMLAGLCQDNTASGSLCRSREVSDPEYRDSAVSVPLGESVQKASKMRLLGSGDYERIVAALSLCDAGQAAVMQSMYAHRINAIKSTSAGRLFDAVSAILGIRRISTYEGEAATALMYAAVRYRDAAGGERLAREEIEELSKELKQRIAEAEEWKCHAAEERAEDTLSSQTAEIRDVKLMRAESVPGSDSGKISDGNINHLPTASLVSVITEQRLAGEDPAKLAYFFHDALAGMIVREVTRISLKTGITTAALTGGVYQNRLLLELTEDGLRQAGIRMLRHHLIPPNDGGIALGQAACAAAWLARQ